MVKPAFLVSLFRVQMMKKMIGYSSDHFDLVLNDIKLNRALERSGLNWVAMNVVWHTIAKQVKEIIQTEFEKTRKQ